MTDKRRLDVALTIFITADLSTDSDNTTEIGIVNVANTVLASMLPIGDAAPTSPEFREVMATATAKAGLRFLLNEMEGKHAGKPPQVNTPHGATA